MTSRTNFDLLSTILECITELKQRGNHLPKAEEEVKSFLKKVDDLKRQREALERKLFHESLLD